jgi:23S rRNA pseudouridine955/2504/2580 synthase
LKEFTVTKNDAGQRLDRFGGKVVPALPSSLAQKYIRIKRIKVNDKGSKRDHKLLVGETVQLYISDKFLETAHVKVALPNLSKVVIDFDIVYEDANILLVNKSAGILCYDTHGIEPNTLINQIQAYIMQKDEWHPHDENIFSPALCNRIDRNTSGIVIAAKNAEALRIMNDKIRLREIDKYYLAAVHGTPTPKTDLLTGYISKNTYKNLATVSKTESPDTKYAETEYKTLKVSDMHPLSLLECRLITGRTHQIRAQLTDIGHPLLGDIKYGGKLLNEPYNEIHQALCSYKITFAFKSDAGLLSYLNGKSFLIDDAPFLKYFDKQLAQLLTDNISTKKSP